MLLHPSSAWWSTRFRQRLLGYVLALLISGAPALVTLFLAQRFPAFNLEGVLLMAGVVVVALTWGVGPGLLVTLVSTWLLAFVVLPPHFSWQPQDPSKGMEVLVLLLGGGGISVLASQSARVRRRAEALAARLAEAEVRHDLERLRLRALVDALPVPVALLDAQEQMLEFNPALQTFLGVTCPPRVLADCPDAKAWWPATGRPVTPRAWPIARAALTGERVTTEEIELETVDGQRKIVLDSATPIRDERGVLQGAVGVFQDMTERKRLEAALRQAEREAAARARELEAIFEALTDGLVVYDAEGRIVRSNQAASQLFGFEAHPEFVTLSLQERAVRYAPRDVEGQPVPPEHFVPARVLRGEIFTSAQATDQRLHMPEGREVTLSMTGRPLRDAEGTITGAVGIARDVTERQRLEREVAERAAQLEAIFESIADGVCVTDRQRRVQHMNQAYRALLGLDLDPTGWTSPQLEEVAGFAGYTPAGEPLIEVENPITRMLQGEVLTNEQSVDIILRMRAEREVWLNLSGAPIRDATGQLLGSVLVARDVTEQRHLEQQTRETLKALLAMAEALVKTPEQGTAVGVEAASERHLAARHLAELTRQVLECQQASIVAVEPATTAMTPITLVGFSPEQEQQWWSNLEERPRLSERLHPDVVAALETGEPVLVERLQPPPPIWHQLTPDRTSWLVPMRIGETLVGLLRVDGSKRGGADVIANRQTLLRAVARLGALVLERERLLREREEAHASVLVMREANRQLETFLGMASHELKTPLTSILMGQEMLQRRMQRLWHALAGASEDVFRQVDAVQALADTTHQQAGRLNRLVNDLLDASRIQSGRLTMQLTPVDLATVVCSAVEEQQQAEPERLMLLSLHSLGSVPVQADAERIGQVVTNYLTNALKYSPEDRPVTVGLDVQDQQARVWVRDEGPGIPPDEQKRLWERFHRVPGIEIQSGSGIGLGIGLYISKTIIEQHSGQVGVQSTSGAGATFWFTLPLTSTDQRPQQRDG